MPYGIGYQPRPSPWSRVGEMLMSWGSNRNARRTAERERDEEQAFRAEQSDLDRRFRTDQASAAEAHRAFLERARLAELADQGISLAEPDAGPMVSEGPPPVGTGSAIAPPGESVPQLSPRQQRELAEFKERTRLASSASASAAAQERAAAAQERARRTAALQGALQSLPEGSYLGEPEAIAPALAEGVPISAFQPRTSTGTGPGGVTPTTFYTQQARNAFAYLEDLEQIDNAFEKEKVTHPEEQARQMREGRIKALNDRRGYNSPADALAVINNPGGVPAEEALPEPDRGPAISLGPSPSFLESVGFPESSAGPSVGPTREAAATLAEPAAGPQKPAVERARELAREGKTKEEARDIMLREGYRF